jgi:hypothetical protein
MEITNKTVNRPLEIRTQVVLEVFCGVESLLASILFFVDPHGAIFAHVVQLLVGIPIGNYLPLGLWFFFAFGVTPLLTAYGVWYGRNWARPLVIVLGWVWVSFIAFKTYIFGLQIFDSLLFVCQLAVVLLMFTPAVKAYFYIKAMKRGSFSYDDLES